MVLLCQVLQIDPQLNFTCFRNGANLLKDSKKDDQIKQLIVELSDLQSQYERKSQAMEKLKDENRVVLKQYSQLKAKAEKNVAAGLSLDNDPSVSTCVWCFYFA